MNIPTCKRMACLGVYWAVNLLLCAGVQVYFGQGTAEVPWFAKFILALCSGWLILLPLIATSWLALARQAWWRRPLVALGLMLSLDGLWWLLRIENGVALGSWALFLWFPFLASAVVWTVLALLGHWRTALVDEDRGATPQTQFALWEMFVWTLVVAALIWPVQRMIIAAVHQRANDPYDYLDVESRIVRYFAAVISICFVPPLTLIVASLVRILLNRHGPSLAICLTLLLGLAGFVAVCGYLNSSGLRVDQPFAIVVGMLSHALWLGYFLRRLGYRIESRSWFVSARSKEAEL